MALTKISRGLLNTGVSDSSDATAITIDSSENVLIGTTSGSDPLVVSDSGASSVTARFINTNADANPANIRLQKLSGSPADNDYIGMINVSGENDASEETIFQSIDFISTDVSDGTEDGDIVLRTRGGGTLAERLRITGSGSINVANSMSFASNHFTFTNSIIGTYSNNYMYVYGGSAGLIMGDNYDGSNRILLRDSNTIEFETNGSERVRIDSSGNFLIGTSTTRTGTASLSLEQSNSYIQFRQTGAQAVAQIQFYRNTDSSATYAGGISTTGTSVTYSTSSDYRLKENINYEFDALNRVKQLKPARFNFIADETNTLVDGFLAHEVSNIVPEAISGEKDAMTSEVLYTESDELPEGKKVGDVKTAAEIDPQGIDHSKLVPLLTKSIQELSTKLEAAEARITTLEG